MNRIFACIILSLLFLTTSCIPTKDIKYFQNANNEVVETSFKPVVLKPYRAQINDVLSIKIKALDAQLVEMFNISVSNSQGATAESLYFDGYTVNDHGKIRVPVLGEIEVIGLTLEEIRIKIEKKLLDEYFNKEADIFVNVKLAGMRYTINGEITSPGTKVLFQDKVTILEAIANSGDILITGNRRDVMVVRQYPHGTEIHSIDLTTVDALKSPIYYVQPNDYIYIQPVKQKTWGTGTVGLQSFTTIVSAFTLLLTTYFLIKK